LLLRSYLAREIRTPFIALLTLFVVVFASYSTARFLTDAVNGLLPSDVIASLVALKTLIALEVLLPIALYLAVVAALSRLYGESEMTAMFAGGASPHMTLRAVFSVSLVLAVLVGCLSLYVRPWAYRTSYDIRAEAESRLDLKNLEGGIFYESASGSRVIFIDQPLHDNTGNIGSDRVFVQFQRNNETTRVIYADKAYPQSNADGSQSVLFRDGQTYDLNRDGSGGQIMKFREMMLHLKPPAVDASEYRRKATSSAELAKSAAPTDVAELQWRLSTPLSTMLLGLLGSPLSRHSPRQGGRHGRMVAAILVYAAYYLLNVSAKNWVEHGTVPILPGIWWVPGLLATLLLFLLLPPGFWRRLRR